MMKNSIGLPCKDVKPMGTKPIEVISENKEKLNEKEFISFNENEIDFVRDMIAAVEDRRTLSIQSVTRQILLINIRNKFDNASAR